MKMYSAFIISSKPIDLSNLSDDQEIEHLIVQEFEVEEELRLVGKRKHFEWIAKKSAPKNCEGDKSVFSGNGSIVPEAIADWFKKVCKSLTYRPVYFNKKT